MQNVIRLLESMFSALPLTLLELWGSLAYAVGAALAICAYGRFTFRPNGGWGFGRERQTWNARAFLSVGLSFVLVPMAGWIGSGIVLVEGAQTLESLKDVMVFLCIVLFGFPAMVAIPPAYMLSDLAEGVPPGFVWDWAEGYFFWVSFVWVAYQLIGPNPDFKRAQTWGFYGLFVAQLMFFDPVMWGLICSGKFSAAISYRVISPALSFTLLITWALAPFFMLAALPLARKLGLYWADLPGHVKSRRLGATDWTWESGQGKSDAPRSGVEDLPGVPLRIVLASTFIALVLAVTGTVAYLALRSGADGASKMALRLHQEISDNIDIRLDAYLDRSTVLPEADRLHGMGLLLAGLPIAQSGRAFVVDQGAQVLAASKTEGATDPVIATALLSLREHAPGLLALRQPLEFRFDVLIAKPLSRETWLARVTPYTDNAAQVNWLAVTAMPESYYLADVQAGNSRTAQLCAIALILAIVGAGLLSALVAAPTRRITAAAEAMAAGDLTQRVAGSRLAEMGALVNAFNRMAAQLQDAFRRSRRSEETLKGIFSASPVALAVFQTESLEPVPMDMQRGRLIADVNEAFERATGHKRDEIVGQSSSMLKLWARPEDRQQFADTMYLRGRVQNFEARILRVDGSEFYGLVSGQDVLVNDERLSIVAVEDVSAQKLAHAQLEALNRQLNALLDAAVEVAIIATDPGGNITVFNSGAEKMLGYKAAEMIGQPALKVHLPDDIAARAHELSLKLVDADAADQLYAAHTADGASTVRNWIFLRKDGRPVQVSMALSAVRDEQRVTLGYLGIARDITEQLAAQAEMIELNTHLDQRVRDRTLALEESKARLEQALDHLRHIQNKLIQSEKLAGLGHIVAAVAHELNTPIGNCVTVASTLHGATETIDREMADGSLRKQRFGEYLSSMLSGTTLLERALHQAAELVNNFKRVAVDQGSGGRRVFDLLATINDTLILLRPNLKKTPFTVEVEVAEGIEMDSFPGALEQVLVNLVNNSVMHGFADREHGRMHVSAAVNEEHVKLVFTDDGHGMSADTVSRIFDPFFTTALGKGGSGLGMNISYNLVTGPLGGDIEVSSVQGEGARFMLILPLSPAEHPARSEVEG